MPETVTLDQVIDLLNKLVQLDQPAINSLLNQRVRCNSALLKHHTVPVQLGRQGNPNRVGFLGIINAFFAADEAWQGPIAAILKDGELTGFTRTDQPTRDTAAITITY